jgi:hypothetical protein
MGVVLVATLRPLDPLPANAAQLLLRIRTYDNLLLLDSAETEFALKFTDNGGTIKGMGEPKCPHGEIRPSANLPTINPIRMTPT